MNLRRAIRDAIFLGLGAGESLLGLKDPLTPPRKLMNLGSNSIFRNDFSAICEAQFRYLVDVGWLRRDDNVLDIGFGLQQYPWLIHEPLRWLGRIWPSLFAIQIVLEAVPARARTSHMD